jgi:hypothetical protein
VRIRGALHIHSTLSRDGTMAVPELAAYFKEKGYHFLAMSEHAEDMTVAKVETLIEQSAAASSADFCVIAGVEFAVTKQIHIVGVGVTKLLPLESPVYVAEQIRALGGISILAHPKRMGWDCPTEVAKAVDAAEIWNINYDGKFLPSAKALPAFQRMRQANPKLLAIACHDFHRKASFYGIGVEMDVPALAREPIFQNLRSGAYRVRSTFFNCESDGRVSATGAALVRHVSGQLEKMRKARSGFARRTA